MLAIDTNVVVRLLVRDDADQTARAQALIENNDIVVPITVVLETAWVLGGPYRYSRSQIAAAIADFAGLPRVTLENPLAVRQALTLFRDGLDFADALHLAQASGLEGLATFDRSFAKEAARLSETPVRLL